MSQEIELKLALPKRALPALRRHPLVSAATPLGKACTLDNIYYDTPDLALKARKVAVRTRRQGRQWLQTVKCAAVSTAGLSQRPEWEQPYHGRFDFSGIDAPDTARLLLRHAEALVPVLNTRFRRETRRYSPREGVSILMMIDTGTIIASERSAPICELELELEQGEPLDLLELACALAQTLPLMPSDQSKAERGYRLFLNQPSSALRAEPSSLRPEQAVLHAFRSLAHACLRQWQANAAAALTVGPDPEFIHQQRVALRRLRALLKLFAPVLPAGFVAEWNPRLRDQAGRHGEARDLDVLQAELLAPVLSEHLIDAEELARLEQVVIAARDQACRLASRKSDAAPDGKSLLDFSVALLRLPDPALSAAGDLPSFARQRLDRLRRRGRRLFEAAAERVPSRLHALRIGIKQLRYGVEFFAPLFPKRALERYMLELVRAQSSLGFLQDVDSARGRLQQWVARDGSLSAASGFVLGWHAPRYARMRKRVLTDCKPLLWGKTPW